MSSATIACLLVGSSALAAYCVAWRLRFSSAGTGREKNEPGRIQRDWIALSALSCGTASIAMYLVFVAVWLYSSRGLNGRLGAAVIWAGLALSVYAIVAGLFARSASRILIIVSSLAAMFLWSLAGGASAVV